MQKVEYCECDTLDEAKKCPCVCHEKIKELTNKVGQLENEILEEREKND
jgi:hypothetical protein